MKEFTLEASFNNVGWLRKQLIKFLLWGWQFTVKLPEDWQEMSLNQYLVVCKELLQEKPKHVTHSAILLQLLSINKYAKSLVGADDAYTFLLPCLDFLQMPIVLDEPKVKRLKGSYFGPGKNLLGLCLKQYGLAELLCQRFMETKDKELLIHLAVLLYPCTVFQPRKQELFESLKEENQAKRFALFKTLPEHVIFAAYLNYLGLRNSFILGFKNFYPSVKTKGTEGGEQEPTDWQALIINISNGPFGDYQSTSMEPIGNAMKYLDLQAQKVKKTPVIEEE
jgi:hypothetical protein